MTEEDFSFDAAGKKLEELARALLKAVEEQDLDRIEKIDWQMRNQAVALMAQMPGTEEAANPGLEAMRKAMDALEMAAERLDYIKEKQIKDTVKRNRLRLVYDRNETLK